MSLICLQLGGPSLEGQFSKTWWAKSGKRNFSSKSGKGNVPRLGGPSLASARIKDLVGPSLARDLSLSAWPAQALVAVDPIPLKTNALFRATTVFQAAPMFDSSLVFPQHRYLKRSRPNTAHCHVFAWKPLVASPDSSLKSGYVNEEVTSKHCASADSWCFLRIASTALIEL